MPRNSTTDSQLSLWLQNLFFIIFHAPDIDTKPLSSCCFPNAHQIRSKLFCPAFKIFYSLAPPSPSSHISPTLFVIVIQEWRLRITKQELERWPSNWNIYCSCRGPEFSSQNTHWVFSQLPVTPWDLPGSEGTCTHMCIYPTYIHKYIYNQNKIIFKRIIWQSNLYTVKL